MTQAQDNILYEDAPQLMAIDTAEDSAVTEASADSVSAAPAVKVDFLSGNLCVSAQAPTEYTMAYSSAHPAYYDGVAPEARPFLPGYDSGVAAMVIGVFLLLALNLRHYTTFLKGFAQDLWAVRSRDNLFEDHTVSETKVILSLIMLVCLSEGILLNTVALNLPWGDISPFVSIGILTFAAGVYYLWQFLVYNIIGYVFTSRDGTHQWVRGFNASQVLLGLVLWVPALVVLFNPSVSASMAILGAVLYILARIIFICKGFRIFYNNLFSLLYFILYLCALEIIPLILAYKTSRY
ncbi:MAG: DUF4271 domain-containing protein [Paramuribaculum sp.]|nr:DUF4271 domain-containing protein [Paramuribaculum sp.]